MSILKKNVLAIALVAGLGLAGTAGAYTLKTNGDANPVLVASADVVNATTEIGVNENFTIDLVLGDFILGRTTGFTVRYILDNGATFGEPLDNADLTIGSAAPGWTVSVAAGGGIGTNTVVINFTPPAAPTSLTVGNLLTIAGAATVTSPTPPGTGQILKNLTALQTNGAVISANVTFVDPVTAAAIMSPGTSKLLQSGNPVVQTCSAAAGDTTKTIDVGVTGTQASKTYFSSTGAIGLADSGYINVGSINAAITPGFGSFAYAATDSFVTTVTGRFVAFTPSGGARNVFLSTSNTCASQDVVGVVNTTNNTVTFTYTGASVAAGPGGFTAYVCASVPAGNTTVIDATAVSESTVFTRGAVTSAGPSCTLLPLRYNGSVVDVYHINPAGNSTAQSFIRVINPSNNAGKVTLTGIDDNGIPALTPITFILGAGKSMQINSIDLESGNASKGLTGAWGDGFGKWRGTVTGEFGDMVVQSLNRNATNGTVTNLTDADNRGEQVLNAILNNN